MSFQAQRIFKEFTSPDPNMVFEPKQTGDLPILDAFQNQEQAEKFAKIINKHFNDKAYVKEAQIDNKQAFKVFVSPLSEEDEKLDSNFQDKIKQMKEELSISVRKRKLKDIYDFAKNLPNMCKNIDPKLLKTIITHINFILQNIQPPPTPIPETPNSSNGWVTLSTQIIARGDGPLLLNPEEGLRKLNSKTFSTLKKLFNVVLRNPPLFLSSDYEKVMRWRGTICEFENKKEKEKMEIQKQIKLVDAELRTSSPSGQVEVNVSKIVGEYLDDWNSDEKEE